MADSKPRKRSSDDAVAHVQAKGGEEEHGEGFGEKDIGFWGSVCLLANNITGPGMVQIPVLFQQAGWLIPTVAFVYIGFLSGLTSMFLAKAVSQIPGNSNLSLRIEFGNLAKMLFPRWLYLVVFAALIFNFQVTNMSSIVVSAQVMDDTLLAAAGKTCALYLYPQPASGGPFQCIDNSGGGVGGNDSPFGNPFVISLGYIITMAITIPLGYLNLDDNIWVQYGGFLLLVMCILGWVVQFVAISGLDFTRMPLVVGPGLSQVLPTVVFNWGFLTTIPSWLNEKTPGVSVSRSIWTAIAISGVMFFLLGILGAAALNFPNGEDLLSALSDPNVPRIIVFSKVCAYIFPSAALLSGIPVFSIIIRYNLLENKVCNKFWANMFAVVFPWVVSLGFFPGTLLATLINWSSAILFVGLNFCLPMMLYLGINSDAGRAHILKAMREQGQLPGMDKSGVEVSVDGVGSLGKLETEALTKPSGSNSLNNVGSASSAGGLDGAVPASKKTLSRQMMSFVRREVKSTGEVMSGFDGSLAHDAAHAKEHLHLHLHSGKGDNLKAGSGGIGGFLSSLFMPAKGVNEASHSEGTGIPLLSTISEGAEVDGGDLDLDVELDWSGGSDVSELPSWWPQCCGWRTPAVTARVWLWSSTIIAIGCFVLQVYTTASPPASAS